MKIWILFLLLVPLAHAQDAFDLPEEELNPEAEEILLKKPEKYLRNESMIYDLNTDLGIKDQRKYTGEDRNRASLAAHISGDYEHYNHLLGADFTFMRRSTRYHQAWYGLQIFQHNTRFGAITNNHEAQTGDDANADSQYQRPSDSKSTIQALGLGAGYRFKLLLDFFETEDMFESIDVFANYIRLNDSFIKKNYQGYGLSTNYGIHKRANTSYFYGGKFSYNIATVTRDAIGSESKSSRSFALGWLSLAFELGFFF